MQRKCPSCGRDVGDSTPLRRAIRESPGDIDLCFYCGALCKFDDELQLVPLNLEEIRSVMKSEYGETLRKLQRSFRMRR